jgi:hypothetical protein
MAGNVSQRSAPRLWPVVLLVAAIIAICIANYLGLLGSLHFTIGPFFSHHWMSIIGATYIAVVVPIQRYLWSRDPERRHGLVTFHIYGNLIAVGLITVHFSQQLSRPAEFFPDLGTGLALYVTLVVLVVTGIFMRFGIGRSRYRWWRYLHGGVTTAFYIVVVFHTLHGLGLI